ncbi:hypothetical protein B1729_07635 [Microbacterium sp. B35-04]|uniref:SDR family NAD(P)-dependent oxidoreductase n=1 Tax=unclassified Microbacterium TaxID=2609290 RepID=UPI0013CF8136|nr:MULTISPECIES: SDR family NAD(P)-dependent oxidoreductase [unclassified Microbacterium]KAF2413853.1 hypothetical protein B1729_07635 [Microbacterium sp. B35-04]KAF2419459.1 hypothetical protein B2K11_06800 [Microbacterium sp. B35-30]
MNGAAAPVVVITGASSGIGRETARMYAKKGARLVLASRSKDALETVAEECRALGAVALVVPTDVSHEGQVRALAAAAHSEYGASLRAARLRRDGGVADGQRGAAWRGRRRDDGHSIRLSVVGEPRDRWFGDRAGFAWRSERPPSV